MAQPTGDACCANEYSGGAAIRDTLVSMIWIGLSVVVLIAAVVGFTRPRNSQQDMGSVSSTWIAENRSESR